MPYSKHTSTQPCKHASVHFCFHQFILQSWHSSTHPGICFLSIYPHIHSYLHTLTLYTLQIYIIHIYSIHFSIIYLYSLVFVDQCIHPPIHVFIFTHRLLNSCIHQFLHLSTCPCMNPFLIHPSLGASIDGLSEIKPFMHSSSPSIH